MPELHEVRSPNAEAPVETTTQPVKMQAEGAACQEGQLANDSKPSAKNADKQPPVAKGAAREDEGDAPKKATVRHRQQPHNHMRRPAGYSPGQSSRLAVARPLNSGATRRRSGDHGFSVFFEHCKRLLAAASYRGSTKNPLDALGVVFLPFLAARFPLERYFLRRQTSSRVGASSRPTNARKPKAIDNQAAASDAVLLGVDKDTRKAHCTTVKTGAGNQGAGGVQEPRAFVAKVGDAAPNKSPQARQGGKLAELAVPAPPTPQAADMLQRFVGLLGPTFVPEGRACPPEAQHCPRFGRGFLAIRHSAFVYQNEEWKPRGNTLYLPLTTDVMINVLRVEQLSFESGQFFLADGKGHYIGAKSGHAIHFWRYDQVTKKLSVTQSVVFLDEQDYIGVLQQLESI